MAEATLRVFRGDSNAGQTVDYRVPVAPGMVVLDALHHIQAISHRTSPSVGIAKQGSAAPAPPKSTAARA